MRIVIGETTRNGSAAQYKSESESVSVEARCLEIRDKRSDQGSAVSGRVITLLVPEGYKIPRGVETGDYRIYLRFVHRRQPRF